MILAFVDYEKLFNQVEYNALLKKKKKKKKPENDIKVIENTDGTSTGIIRLHKHTDEMVKREWDKEILPIYSKSWKYPRQTNWKGLGRIINAKYWAIYNL